MASSILPQTKRDLLMLRIGTCLGDERYDTASRALAEFLRAEPQDRECWLLWLLCNIKIHGLQPCEHEIEKVKRFSNLDCREKAIIKQILVLAVQQARLERRDDLTVAYQRLVGSLVRGSPLDSCSTAEKTMGLPHFARSGAVRLFKSQESLPVSGWRPAALFLLLASISVMQTRAEGPIKGSPIANRPIPPVAFESRSSDAKNSAFRSPADGGPTSHSGPSSRSEPARSKDVAASYASYNSGNYGDASQQGKKGNSSEASKLRAEKRKTARVRKQSKSRSQAAAKPVPASPTESDHLGIYRTRVPVNVRQELGFAAPTLETIGASEEVTVLESKGNWLKVRTRDGGNVGYVPKDVVVPADAAQSE